MNIKKMRLALLAHASFMPFDKNKLTHKVLCALSSVALIESASAATQKAVLNVTTGGANTTYPLDKAISNDPTNNPHSDPSKELWIKSDVPIVSTANHTYAGATVIGQNIDSSGSAVATAATFYNIGRIGSTGQSFTVNPNGVLRGSGTVIGNISNAGTVSPGNNGITHFTGEPSLPVGTVMNVTGNYTSTGQTWLYFSPTAGDKMVISGAFDASSGTLYITPRPGYYPPDGTVQYTAISHGSTTATIGSYAAGSLPPNIIITTAAADANYLELNVTAHQTSTGLAFTFAGVDRNIDNLNGSVNPADLTKVTGTINAASGTVIEPANTGTSVAPVITAIATQFSISANGGATSTATVQPTENSKTQLAGPVVGDAQAVLAITGGSAATAASRVVEVSGDASAFSGTYSASNAKLVINTVTPGNVNAGSGAILSGTGSVGAVTVNGGTLKPGNSIGTSTYASLNATSTTHYQVEMNNTDANKIIVSGDANLGTDFIVDVLMDADTYTSATRQILTVGGTLTGNVNTLTWTDQTGLVFDIDLDTSNKIISLVSAITPSVIIASDQASITDYTAGTYTSRKKRRIITSTFETTSSLIGNYDYITLINGTISNDADRSLSAPINIVGSSAISTSSGTTTTLGTANTLAGASGATLNITSAGTTAITAANPNFLGTLAVGSGATLNLGSSATFDSAPTPSTRITLTAGTLQLVDGMTLIYPVSVLSGTSTINTTGTPTLSGALLSGALSNASGSTLKLTGGTTTINRSNTGLLGTLNVDNSTLYLGSSAILGSGELTLTSGATLNNSSSSLTNPISATSSTINVDAGKNLGSGALSLNDSTLNFTAVGGGSTTTLTNSGISIAGASTIHNNVGSVYLGSGALSGTGTLNFTSGNASNITYITANNSGFTGPVNISSKINIGNGSNLGTTSSGLVTMTSVVGSIPDLTLGNVLLSNPFAIASSSNFTVIAGATAELSGAFSGSGNMAVTSSTGNSGIFKLSGSSSGYTSTINATNINLLMNGTTGASLNAGAGTTVKGTGTIGAVTLTSSDASIQPGVGGFETLTVSSLTISGSQAHLNILIGPHGEKSKLKITGGAALDSLKDLTVNILYADTNGTGNNTYPIGTVNYEFLLGDGVNTIASKVNKITWPTQTGISFQVGFDDTGKLIAQSTVAPSGGAASINLPAVTTYVPTGRSETNATASILNSIATTNYNAGETAPTVDTVVNTANAPVNLNTTTLTNSSGASKTLNSVFGITGTSEIHNATSNDITIFAHPMSTPVGSTLKITGAGTTTFSNDSNSSILGAIDVSGSSTVNVQSGLGSGNVSLADTSTLVVQNGATLNNAVATVAGTQIKLQPAGGGSVTVNQALSGAGNVSISGGGTANFNAANTSLSGSITLNASRANIANAANLGTGGLNLINSTGSGTAPTVIMGDVTLPNPISATVASTFTVNPSATAILSGAITGNKNLTFNGTGTKRLTANSPDYTGTMNVSSGTLNINGNFSNASVNIASGATLAGAGRIGDVILNHGALVNAGDSSTTKLYAKSWSNDSAIYTVRVNNTGGINTIVVEGNASLVNPTFNILADAGTYRKGVIDRSILRAGGTLSVTGTVTLNYVQPATGDHGTPYPLPITYTAGTLAKKTNGVLTNYLILKETLSDDVTVATNQTSTDGSGSQIYSGTPPLSPITIEATDIVAADSGLRPDIVPVQSQVELTSIVFQSNSSEITSAATADAFRFKGFSSGATPSVTGGKNSIEALLTAISKNGPVSYEHNETRLWVTPFANRSRTNRTSSDVGNQGWSGGSLIGLEQRDKKNTWSLGLLTGLMGSRSHVLGAPDSFSKTKGFLIGAFNTYKYTKKWGHEALISRTSTLIDSQRYGLDKQDNQTPFYALSNYKAITDVANAQINYLFNIIKKKVTCRLNTGVTYTGSQSGNITERNAGTNGLNTTGSTNKSAEFYNGIGIRRIWEIDKVMIRTTLVYEYGYHMMNTGSSSKTTTQSVAPTTFTTPIGPRQNKHYLQLNSSYLDRDTGLKFILSYSGALYKNVKNHTGMFKVEYRF